MSSDLDDQNMRRRDELRGTEAGRDPWFGVRLMHTFEERELSENKDATLHEAGRDDGRPR